eukprot:723757-Pyramimonas_sp.AAC.1
MAACKTEKELEQMFDPHSYRNFMMLGTNEVRKVHRGDLMRGRTLVSSHGLPLGGQGGRAAQIFPPP